MTHVQWKKREVRKVWLERLQMWAGGLLLGAGLMMFAATCLQIDSILAGL